MQRPKRGKEYPKAYQKGNKRRKRREKEKNLGLPPKQRLDHTSFIVDFEVKLLNKN